MTAARAKSGLRLRLYIAGDAPNSVMAVANLTSLCAEHFPSSVNIEVVDLLEHPGRALADGIVVTPTLLRLSPLPVQRVVGSLRDTQRVLLALGGK